MNALAKFAPMPGAGPSGNIAALAFGLLAVFIAAALYVRNANAQANQNGPQSPFGFGR